MTPLTLTQPDDCHVHLRDGPALSTVVPHTARRFARAIVMPNLKPPVTTVAQALAYRERILQAVPRGTSFRPLMTLYLTDATPPTEIARARYSDHVLGVKLYPAGATTHSEAGVTALDRIYPTLEAMEDHGLPLMIHGEVTDPTVDVFDRERVFIDRHLVPLVERFAGLRIVLEHITTRDAVQFVMTSSPRVAATITAHHLLLNRNALFQDGLRPHHYCLPVLKRESHREAVCEAAFSGNPKFFLGSDSAPHAREAKESGCGCAGIYTGHAALELYAEAFSAAGRLDRLESFASHFGAHFYGLPRNKASVTLVPDPWLVPAQYTLGQQSLIPLRAGEYVTWRLTEPPSSRRESGP